jgi:2-oxoglutarate ferredoxin oxidoreductase subunit alpha
MTLTRAAKIAGIAKDIDPQIVEHGDTTGALAVVGWGSTYGAINQAVMRMRTEGLDVSHIHLRHIWPLPANLGDLLAGYTQVLVPEMNTGQLLMLIRSEHLIPAEGLNKVSGQPFKVEEIEAAIKARLRT